MAWVWDRCPAKVGVSRQTLHARLAQLWRCRQPAHDRALRLLPRGDTNSTRQLAMMLVMVGYTFTGPYLLFGR